MSEKIQKVIKTIRRGWFGLLGANVVETPEKQNWTENSYIDLVRARNESRPAGPGLKEWQLLQDPNFTYGEYRDDIRGMAPYFFHTFSTMLKQYKEKHPPEARADDDSNVFIKLIYSGMVQSSPSNKLREWLEQNTPQNGYFTPEMIEAAIAEDERIAVKKREQNGISFWQFSDQKGNNFELSRRTDGQKPNVPVAPYLGIFYRSEYDFDKQEVVSTPRVSSYFLKGGDDTPLAQMVLDNLGATPFHIPKEINFEVKGAKAMPYFTGADASSLESVWADPYVLASLPGESGE